MKISRIVALTLMVLSGQTTAGPCQPPPDNSQMTLSVESGEQSSIDAAPNTDVSLTQYNFSIWSRPQTDIRPSLGHRYSIFDIDNPDSTESGEAEADPVTNGHLHTLYAPLDLSPLLAEHWRLRVQPTLSVSSNLLKDLGEIKSDAWQMNVGLFRHFAVSSSSHWAAGLCGDHRFGDYRVYPSLRWVMQKGKWSIRLGYPDTDINASVSDALTTGVRFAPAGNRWFVHDSDAGDSLFIHEAWRAEWYVDWHVSRSWRLNLNIGKLIDNYLEFELANGNTVRTSTDSPWQVRAGIVWHY